MFPELKCSFCRRKIYFRMWICSVEWKKTKTIACIVFVALGTTARLISRIYSFANDALTTGYILRKSRDRDDSLRKRATTYP